LGAQYCACILVHSNSMGVLAWLLVELPLESQVLFYIEIHVPTYASAVPSKTHIERERERELKISSINCIDNMCILKKRN